MCVPDARETTDPPFLTDDPLGEDADMPVPGLVHRYCDRALLLATTACAAYCRHCTRKRVAGQTETCVSRTRLAQATDYLAVHPEIHDVIISGGDPFTMTTAALERVIRAVREVIDWAREDPTASKLALITLKPIRLALELILRPGDPTAEAAWKDAGQPDDTLESLRQVLEPILAGWGGEIILGHYLAMVLMIFAQVAILIVFGQLAVGVEYARTPLATLLVAAAMALWVASLGLLIGVVAKTEEQVVIFSMIPMFVLSALGGAWMPLEGTSETFQAIGHVLPSAWAMDGFKNLVIRGLGFSSVLVPAGIMLAYAVVLFALALWRFEVE
jgi:hypothetical protein